MYYLILISDFPAGYEGGGQLVVAFYNGQTVELDPGVAVRIPLAVFDRIVTELQLPESQRRRIKLASSTSTPQYDGRSPHVNSTWERPFSPPRRQPTECSREGFVKDELSVKIDSQLERNKHLLDRVHLHSSNDELWSPGRSVRFKDSLEFGDGAYSPGVDVEDLEDDEYDDEEEEEVETYDVGVGTDMGKLL